MSNFEQETALTGVSQGRWRGRVDPHWNIGDNPNGGYLISIAMAAAVQLAPTHPDPLTLTVHYLRPGIGGADCTVDAELLRTGRTLSTVRATLGQEGKSRLEVLAGFGDLSAANQADESITVAPPPMPPPEDCIPRSGEEQGVDLPLLSRMDILLHPDEARAGIAGKAQVTGWIRFVDGHPPDTRSVVMFADAFPPSVFGLLGVVGWVPTLELTVHVRRRPVPGWILGQFSTQDLADGRMIEDGALWDESGNLIAQSRQIALVMKRD
jgi:acyl-CoA thioesterase